MPGQRLHSQINSRGSTFDQPIWRRNDNKRTLTSAVDTTIQLDRLVTTNITVVYLNTRTIGHGRGPWTLITYSYGFYIIWTYKDLVIIYILAGLPGFARIVAAKLYLLVHFICRKFILICFLWISWHSQTFDEILTALNPQQCPPLNPHQNAPLGVSCGQFVQPLSIPRFICIICAKFNPNPSSRLTTICQSFELLIP